MRVGWPVGETLVQAARAAALNPTAAFFRKPLLEILLSINLD
jgi:hypothetical protein